MRFRIGVFGIPVETRRVGTHSSTTPTALENDSRRPRLSFHTKIRDREREKGRVSRPRDRRHTSQRDRRRGVCWVEKTAARERTALLRSFSSPTHRYRGFPNHIRDTASEGPSKPGAVSLSLSLGSPRGSIHRSEMRSDKGSRRLPCLWNATLLHGLRASFERATTRVPNVFATAVSDYQGRP